MRNGLTYFREEEGGSEMSERLETWKRSEEMEKGTLYKAQFEVIGFEPVLLLELRKKRKYVAFDVK